MLASLLRVKVPPLRVTVPPGALYTAALPLLTLSTLPEPVTVSLPPFSTEMVCLPASLVRVTPGAMLRVMSLPLPMVMLSVAFAVREMVVAPWPQ